MIILLILTYASQSQLFVQSFSSASCPNNCLCVDRSVVCSCEDALGGSHGNEFKLRYFGGIQFTDSLVIHSCDKVIIPSGTFEGTTIQQTIKIIEVKNLEISSWAFRGLRKAPEQLIIQATTIAYCPPYAFSGLANLKHIWFRNSTIGKLAARSFSDVANIDYIYFRDSAIHHIEDGAFGSMRGVQHFFMRGNITIDFLGNAIFLNSTINEVFLQEAQFTGSTYFFDGLRARTIQLATTVWKFCNNNENYHYSHHDIGRFLINNSTIDQLVLKTFHNVTFLHISNSTLFEITAKGSTRSRSVASMPAVVGSDYSEWRTKVVQDAKLKKQKIEIIKTVIKKITANAFKSVKNFKKLAISHCQIAIIEGNAFRNSKFNKIQIYQTYVHKLSTDAFAAISVDNFSWNECNIGRIENMVFRNSHVGTLNFSGCQIANIAKQSFSALKTKEFILENAKIDRCEEKLFCDAKIRNLSIVGTEIVSGTFGNIFQDLRAIYFHARNNSFDCNVLHCDSNSLVLGEQAFWDLPWHFQANQCTNRKVCRQAPEWAFHGVICKSFRFIVQCLCTNQKYARVPDINASILAIGDCGTLEIDLNKNEKIFSLHIYRTEALKIEKMPVFLQIFEIFHSKITTIKSGAFSGLKMEKIKSVSTQFELIENESFANFELFVFVFRSSTLNHLESHAFINSSVSVLRAEKSYFLHVSDFWYHFSHITLIQTFVSLPKFLLEEAENLCMEEVTVACECPLYELGLRNKCNKMPPICSSRYYSVDCLIEKQLTSGYMLLQPHEMMFSIIILLDLCFRL